MAVGPSEIPKIATERGRSRRLLLAGYVLMTVPMTVIVGAGYLAALRFLEATGRSSQEAHYTTSLIFLVLIALGYGLADFVGGGRTRRLLLRRGFEGDDVALEEQRSRPAR